MFRKYSNVIFIFLIIIGASLALWFIDKSLNKDGNSLSIDKPSSYKDLYDMIKSNTSYFIFNYSKN